MSSERPGKKGPRRKSAKGKSGEGASSRAKKGASGHARGGASEKAAKGKGASGKQGGRKPAGAAGSRRAPSRTRRRARARQGEREFSAGGVVVRGQKVAVIVPTRRAADGSRVLALPKGHADPGETPLQAAEREVREETGVVAEPVCELGETRYWYRRDGQTIGKSVSFFLFSYVEGDISDHDDEVEEVRWLGLKEAQKALSYAGEREMVALADDYLHQDR